MNRRLVIVVLFALLVVALMAPIANVFDQWDTTPGPFADTEFQVCALALMAGLGAIVAVVLAARSRIVWLVDRQRPLQLQVVCGLAGAALRTIRSGGPPLVPPLRI